MTEPERECCQFRLNGLKRYLIGVAVTLTAAIFAQSMALIWWAGAITTRVEHVEKGVDQLAVRVHTIETQR